MSRDRADEWPPAAGSPLAGLGVGTIVYCLQTHLGTGGLFMAGVGPVNRPRPFVGRARTLRCLPTRADVAAEQRRSGAPTPHRQAIDGVSPGEVLVIDARGSRAAAVVGDVLAARVQAAGGAAVVTDGCVRDLPGLARVDLPVYAAGANATLFSTHHLGIAVNEPVACGGVLVLPGDVVVGDAEGVVVVPAQLEEEVARLAREQDELDAFSVEQIRRGVPVSRAYPLDAELRGEFEARRRPERPPLQAT
jgi:5-oxopent-3-ene-1,2,5-tricarboxylate decarboxylase / 2-hydroxyhepta-2,4-diene-1,7-dioate isomerase